MYIVGLYVLPHYIAPYTPDFRAAMAQLMESVQPLMEKNLEEKVASMMVKVWEEFRCIECGRISRSRQALMEKEEKGNCWQCIECGRVTRDIKTLTRKIGEVWKCTQCGKMAEDSKAKARLRRHVETHIMDVSHSCTVCGHNSTTSSALIKHMYKKHPELKVHLQSAKEAKAKKSGSSADDFSELVETSVEEADEKAEALISRIGEVLYCGECGKSMAKEKRWAMRRHVETHLSGMSFSCELCGKQSKSTHGLYQHKMKQHPELKIIKHLSANYKCDICGKGSKTDKGLANHKWKYHRGGARGAGEAGEMEVKMEEQGMEEKIESVPTGNSNTMVPNASCISEISDQSLLERLEGLIER